MNDRDVTALLERRAAVVSTSEPPIDAIVDAARSGRGSHRHRNAFLAAAAVLVLVVGGGLAWDASRDDASLPAPADSPLPVHAGYRWVGMNGIAVEVPATWTTASASTCPAENVDAVIFDQSAAGVCQDPRIDPRASSLHFETLDSRDFIAEMAPQRQRTISIDGVPALLTAPVEINCPPADAPSSCKPVFGTSVEVPDSDLLVWVESPSESTGEEILATARAIPDGEVAVPDLAGTPHPRAGETLLELGLRPRSLCADGGQFCDLGLTIAQTDPLPGSLVRAGSVVRMLATDPRPNAGFPPSAQMLPDGRLEVSVAGSSSCPLRASAIESVGAQHVRVQLGGDSSGGCTADVKMSTSRIALPADVRRDEPVIGELVTSAGNLRGAVLAVPAPTVYGG